MLIYYYSSFRDGGRGYTGGKFFQVPLTTMNNEETFSSNCASELRENLDEMYPLFSMDDDVISNFNYSTTH